MIIVTPMGRIPENGVYKKDSEWRKVILSESINRNMVTVCVDELVAGVPEAKYIFHEPFLRGEDYPTLVELWDNEEDSIYD